MSYKIETIEYHKAELENISNRMAVREDRYRGDDGHLSQWADGSMISYHRLAIQCLEDGMVDYFPRLMDGKRELDAKMINGQYGLVWILSDDEADTYGRKFIPVGRRSRVQRELGLKEVDVERPISRWLDASCGFVGGAITFYTQEARP